MRVRYTYFLATKWVNHSPSSLKVIWLGPKLIIFWRQSCTHVCVFVDNLIRTSSQLSGQKKVTRLLKWTKFKNFKNVLTSATKKETERERDCDLIVSITEREREKEGMNSQKESACVKIQIEWVRVPTNLVYAYCLLPTLTDDFWKEKLAALIDVCR